jgi:hypothetical protein
MATQTTEMRRSPTKKPKALHPTLIKAKEALEGKTYNPNTPLSQVKPEPVDAILSNEICKRKSGYKVVEFVQDDFQWRKIPVSEEWLSGLSRALVDWSRKDDSLNWINFCRDYGISIDQFDGFVERYPIVAYAKRQAREIIAARRDEMAFLMKASGSVMLGTQTYHSPSYKEHKKEEASWKDKDAQKTGNFNLNFYDQPAPEDKSGSNNTDTSK